MYKRQEPRHAPADHVALLVGDELQPGTERQQAQLFVAFLFVLAARRQVGLARLLLGFLAQAHARLELHGQLGAGLAVLVLAQAARQPAGDDVGLFLVVADLLERAFDVGLERRMLGLGIALGAGGDDLAGRVELALPLLRALAVAQERQRDVYKRQTSKCSPDARRTQDMTSGSASAREQGHGDEPALALPERQHARLSLIHI